MEQIKTLAEDITAFVEVLTTEKSGMPFGYQFFGHRRGQGLLVMGTGETAQAVFDRLISFPSLPWMHGNIVLVRTDLMTAREEVGLLYDMKKEIAHHLELPEIALAAFSVRRHCNDVLRVCADLGKTPTPGQTVRS